MDSHQALTKLRYLRNTSVILQSRVWGVAYRIQGQENISKAIGHLTNREISLGGYEVQVTKCHTLLGESHTSGDIFALVYYAAPGNPCYRGCASYNEISTDILLSYGYCGSNIEYLFRLADFMRTEVRDEKDEHLYAVDNLVRLKMGICTKSMQTWMELIKCNKFLSKLAELSTELRTNSMESPVYFKTAIASQ